jgi:Na+/H+ antiporter
MYEVTLVLGLLVAVITLATVARKVGVPYPIALVLGGLALALAPGLPQIALRPELVFVLFLPPLLYQDALNISYREFRANLAAIVLLATGLVLATTCVVAVVAHWATARTAVPLSWPACFALGAIVSPTDAVAATAIFHRLGVPRRLMVVLEGESLVNDATALILYTTALALATGDGPPFSPGLTAGHFLVVGVGSVGIGLAVGWAIAGLRRHLSDPPVESTISLLTGFAAYLPAYALHLSGVLAVVTTGVYLGRVGPRIVSSRTRLQTQEMWAVVTFLLNGLLFILIGLQLRAIVAQLAPRLVGTFLGVTALVSVAVVVVRLVWMFPGARLARLLTPRQRRQPPAPWQSIVVAGWAGMGGAVSLAAALALPQTLAGRNLMIVASFGVILVTLVGKGLSLPWLVRRLGLSADQSEAREETKARYKAAQAALTRLEALAAEEWAPPQKVAHLRAQYEHRSHVLGAALDGHDDGDHDHAAETAGYQRLRRETLSAERQLVITLRDRGVINDEVLHRIQRELDLEEVRLPPEESDA